VLTSAQRYRYQTEGFITVPQVLTAEQITTARAIVEEFIEKSRGVRANDAVYDLEDDHTPQRPHVRRIKSPAKVHPFFDELLRSEPILDIIESLIGPDIRALGSKLNLKTGDGGSAVEWHQDVAFHPHTNDSVLAVGLALDPATTANGCLLVLPGSHHGPMLDHHQNGVFVGAVDPTTAPVDFSRAVPVELNAGDVSVHHGRLVHGSWPNTSTNPRRLLLWDIAAVDAWPLYKPVTDLDEFNSAIVRGRPTLEPRLAPIPVRVPLPLTPGTIFELQAKAEHKAFTLNR
jgi:ectoine hydroxylase-related dioxygenase (phytanoyl-CoA dioxygenase family)